MLRLPFQTSARWLAAGLVGLLASGWVAWLLWPSRLSTPTWVADYDLTARPPEVIAPGTVIGRSAPNGWSHLVIKSLPRVRQEHEAKLNALTVRMATWLRTAFVADVERNPHTEGPRYRLRAVGLGLGTSVGGQDTIVTAGTAAQQGVELDWITRTILTKGYEIQSLALMVVHGPTFGLLDTPVWFHCAGKNRLIRYRYALLVDGNTGQLEVILWTLEPESACGEASAVVLSPPTIDEAELVPDMKEFNVLGVPSEAGFGVDRFPPYRSRISLRPDLRDLARMTIFTADEARILEAGLRQQLAEPPAP